MESDTSSGSETIPPSGVRLSPLRYRSPLWNIERFQSLSEIATPDLFNPSPLRHDRRHDASSSGAASGRERRRRERRRRRRDRMEGRQAETDRRAERAFTQGDEDQIFTSLRRYALRYWRYGYEEGRRDEENVVRNSPQSSPRVILEMNPMPTPPQLPVRECRICYTQASDACIHPCHHASICFPCAQRLQRQECPFCRQPIGYISHLYY